MKSNFGEFKQSKTVIVGNFRVLNFDISKFEQFSSPKFTEIQSSESLILPKMTLLDCLNSPKFDFTLNRSGGKLIKFQQSQALTSHFESFWSIVQLIVYNFLSLHFTVWKCQDFSVFYF